MAADRPFYSGKHKKHGMSLQVIASPAGDILWVSGALPGAVHDKRAEWTDPLTGREIQLRKTCKTERTAQIELGKLLEQAAAGRQPETNATVAQLMDRYVEIADWDLSVELCLERHPPARARPTAYRSRGFSVGQRVCRTSGSGG